MTDEMVTGWMCCTDTVISTKGMGRSKVHHTTLNLAPPSGRIWRKLKGMLTNIPSNRYMAETVNVLDNSLEQVENGAKRNKRKFKIPANSYTSQQTTICTMDETYLQNSSHEKVLVDCKVTVESAKPISHKSTACQRIHLQQNPKLGTW